MTEYEKFALKKFGEAIQIAIDERKTNVMQVQKKSGVSRSNIYKILNGENYEMTSFIRVCRVLQIHVDFSLMDEKNNVFTSNGTKPSDN